MLGRPMDDSGPNKRRASPGRYSLSDAEDRVPNTRIDSTTRLPAVVAPPTVQASAGARPPRPPPPPPASRPNVHPPPTTKSPKGVMPGASPAAPPGADVGSSAAAPTSTSRPPPALAEDPVPAAARPRPPSG